MKKLRAAHSTVLLKTTAIVLRVQPFSRTSHVVTWFSPDIGRFVTVVKGACRPKSGFAGQYDHFYTCELVFYPPGRTGIAIAKECTPLKLRQELRTDWRAASCASWVADVLRHTTMEGHSHPELFDLGEKMLDFLSASGASVQAMCWFELHTAHALGILPRLEACARCNAPVSETAPTFSVSAGGVICHSCATRHNVPSDSMAPDVLGVLKHWTRATSPRSAFRTKCSPDQLRQVRSILEEFFRYHLDMAPPSRNMVLRMFSQGAASTEGKMKS